MLAVPAVTSAATLRTPPNNLGLVGYWSMEDGSGSIATDFSGSGNDGTLDSSMTNNDWVSGRRGTALDFDGSDDYVDISGFGWSDSSFTVSTWIRPNSWNAGGNMYIINIGDDSNENEIIMDQDSDNLRMLYFNGTAYGVSNGTRPAIDTWSHVVYTFDSSSGEHTYYLNGSADKSVTDDVATDIKNGPDSKIGRDGIDDIRHFDGKIDEVRVYNRALSASQVRDLYESGYSQVNTSRKLDEIGSMVGWWTLDGNDVGPDIQDSSGSGNDGKLEGQNATATVAGRLGQAIDFDGSDDYVRVPDDNSLDMDQTFSLSVWAYESSCSGNYEGLLAKINYNNDNRSYGLERTNGCKLRFLLSGDGTNPSASTETLDDPENFPTKEWVHAAATYDGSTMRLYRNTELVATTSLSVTPYETDDPVTIASHYDAGVSIPFDGVVDDPRIYDTTLSKDEIQRLYNATRPSPVNTSRSNRLTDGLVGFWTLDGQHIDWAKNTAEDVSSNSNDGAITNMSTSSSPRSGKLGQALDFDGVDDYVLVNNSSSLQFNYTNDNYAIAVWAKVKNNQSSDSKLVEKKANDGESIVIDGNGNNSVNFAAREDKNLNRAEAVGTTEIFDDTWHHIVGVKNGGTLKLYVDGVFEASDSTTYGDTNNDADLRIGYSIDEGDRLAEGRIDNVRIYDRALSQDEVKQLYRLGR